MSGTVLENTLQGKGKRQKPKGRLETTVLILPGIHTNADDFDIGEDNKRVEWSRDSLSEAMSYTSEVLKKFPVWQQPVSFDDGTFYRILLSLCNFI